MTHIAIKRKIELAAKKKVKLKINDNTSTMLSVKWEPDCTKVSLHRLFLSAPNNIMEALACHIRHENSDVAPMVKAFIEDRLKLIDYSDSVDKDKLITKGSVYDLLHMYKKINRDYFHREMDLKITWYGTPICKNQSRLTFGLYYQPLRLIKINKMMDKKKRSGDPLFPEFFVEYVIYHEMLHHRCPAYYDALGKHRVHTREFKAEEKKFKYFKEATEWLRVNSPKLFK